MEHPKGQRKAAGPGHFSSLSTPMFHVPFSGVVFVGGHFWRASRALDATSVGRNARPFVVKKKKKKRKRLKNRYTHKKGEA